MKRYSIVVTKAARDDLDDIVDYLTTEAPDYVNRIAGEIQTAIHSLDHLPERFEKAGVSRKRDMVVHRMVVDPYLVYYRIESDTVFITRIRHGVRRPLKRYD